MLLQKSASLAASSVRGAVVIFGAGGSGRRAAFAVLRGGHRRAWRDEELGELPQVLNRCGEGEFIVRAGWSAQPQAVELQDPLEVREQHLDFLSLAA
jgi:hypothetical protein